MGGNARSDVYRKLPSVDELLRAPALASLTETGGKTAVVEAARTVLARLRTEISAGNLDANAVGIALSGLPEAVERELRRNFSYSLRPVINATGVILHTNLGRAPIAENALQRVQEAAAGYSNLEFDLATGERGKRDVHVDRLFRRLLDSASAGIADQPASSRVSTIVVNNNAAAVLLALNTLADAGEVIVSRGELVEIGGSFRIPDVMAKSGAILREVGTTNRTRISDYERAINDRTRLLLRVHRSNFEITGFTEQPSVQELSELARRRSLVFMEDLGSGALFNLQSVGIQGEPSIFDSLRWGVGVVTYSGDKLLGGPQAGLLSGKPELIARIRSNPLFRALRVDKLTYAALEATLLAYIKQDYEAVPTLRMMRLSERDIGERAERVVRELQNSDLTAEVVGGASVIGGGAAPSAVLPTRLIAVTSKTLSADELATSLRGSDPPVIARVEEGRVLLDLRTVYPEQDTSIRDALNKMAIRPEK